jgi:hypothetical protein
MSDESFETKKERKPVVGLGDSGEAILRSVDERGYEICNPPLHVV